MTNLPEPRSTETEPPAGWRRVCEATYAAWRASPQTKSKKLDREVALGAMAFGYAARADCGEHRPWARVVGRLRLDWEGSTDGAEHPWRHVQSAVKAGWVAAGGHREASDDPTNDPRRAPPGESEPERPVAGGRLHAG